MKELDIMFYKQYMLQKQEVQRLEDLKKRRAGAKSLLAAILLENEKDFLDSMRAKVAQMNLPI
jgi:hypothetical protein